MTASPSDSTPPETPAKKGRVGPPRPDEMSKDAFEFISAIDQYKRDEMRSFLELEEILQVLGRLGYERDVSDGAAQVQDLADALERYREEHERLFPNWSEVFTVLIELGYARSRGD